MPSSVAPWAACWASSSEAGPGPGVGYAFGRGKGALIGGLFGVVIGGITGSLYGTYRGAAAMAPPGEGHEAGLGPLAGGMVGGATGRAGGTPPAGSPAQAWLDLPDAWVPLGTYSQGREWLLRANDWHGPGWHDQLGYVEDVVTTPELAPGVYRWRLYGDSWVRKRSSSDNFAGWCHRGVHDLWGTAEVGELGMVDRQTDSSHAEYQSLPSGEPCGYKLLQDRVQGVVMRDVPYRLQGRTYLVPAIGESADQWDDAIVKVDLSIALWRALEAHPQMGGMGSMMGTAAGAYYGARPNGSP